ncbi:MAG: hypothetical protein A2017_12460 [Lentisphaerae bacterium GWF2_44_16]|nr:MAG: hypothetical protein A2017_12460 [Lentisphaerae bacterium GWF2_44_16]
MTIACLKKYLCPFFTAAFFLCLFDISADNAEANNEIQSGLEKFKKEDYKSAAKDFLAAELFADDVSLKAKAVKEAAKAYRKAGLKNKEFDCLEKLLEGYPSHINYPQAVDREFEIGNQVYEGDFDPLFDWLPWFKDTNRIIEIYEKALKHGPFSKYSPEAKLRLGRIYLDANKIEEALKTFREIIKMYPNTIQQKYAYLELANTLMQLSRYGDGDGKHGKEAREVLKAFLEKYPKDPETGWVKQSLLESNDISAKRLYGIARFYHKIDRNEPASRYLNDILKEYPDADISDDSEELLSGIDKEYVPPMEKLKKPLKYQLYETQPLPGEEEAVIAVPENSEGKWLLPIKDKGFDTQIKIKRENIDNLDNKDL